MRSTAIGAALLLAGCASTQSAYEECNIQAGILDSGGIWAASGLIKGDAQIECERRVGYIRSHPNLEEKTKRLIQEGQVAVGMTANEVRASWGPPESINRYSAGRTEQWVYGYRDLNFYFRPTNYIYVENGIVTDWSSVGN